MTAPIHQVGSFEPVSVVGAPPVFGVLNRDLAELPPRALLVLNSVDEPSRAVLAVMSLDDLLFESVASVVCDSILSATDAVWSSLLGVEFSVVDCCFGDLYSVCEVESSSVEVLETAISSRPLL